MYSSQDILQLYSRNLETIIRRTHSGMFQTNLHGKALRGQKLAEFSWVLRGYLNVAAPLNWTERLRAAPDIWRLGRAESDWPELANLPRLLSEKGLMIWWPHPASRVNTTARQPSVRISIWRFILSLRDGRKCLIVMKHYVRLEAIFPPQWEAIRRMYSTWLILNIQLRAKHILLILL